MKNLMLTILLLATPSLAHGNTETWIGEPAKSKLEWEGKKLAGSHQGSLQLKSGELKFARGKLVGGDFAIDMTTIQDSDLTDKSYNEKLINHLKSDDFFSVEKNPISYFKITKVEALKNGSYSVTGDLTIKKITHSVSFPIETKITADHLLAKGKVEVDRTLWDIKFRSSKFFADVGDKVISDTFTIQVEIFAHKK